MTTETDTLPLIRTRLQRPGLPGVPLRRRLGAGASPYLRYVRHRQGHPAGRAAPGTPPAERHNHPIQSLSYLRGAIRTLFPSTGGKALGPRTVSQTPSTRLMTNLMASQ